MKPEDEFQFAQCVERYFNGNLSNDEFVKLESKLLQDADARSLFLDLSQQHGMLRTLDEALVSEQLQKPTTQRWFRSLAVVATIAATILLMFNGWVLWPRDIATLVSNENATWESPLPTVTGAKLEPGYMRLKSGMAKIRFHSGAEVLLEAPATIVLQTTMRARLESGSAIITVPESATGFAIQTPDALAIDHGTAFAVSVSKDGELSSFEVLSGEISIHHDSTGEEIRLTEQQAASASKAGLNIVQGGLSEGQLAEREKFVRITTEGQEVSVARRGELHDQLLTVKLSQKNGVHDRRAIFNFNLHDLIEPDIDRARLRLNLVPSGLGYATRLAELNEFHVYGLIDEASEPTDFSTMNWMNAPQLERCRLIGTFTIPRSRQRESIVIETPELLNFLKSDTSGRVTFVVTRETREIENVGLVHAFASSTHPDVSGPSLELSLNNQLSVEEKAKN
ncbi:MAG: iron dicitrate transport regulator FecR [Blastopirellula sp.]|nr:MAG: iron dicitrate transport regulator FecR [Blastopirellula sp.]